ncbi:ABC transporter ATP-binding protein [Mycoplasmopsis gallinarum]
MARHGFQTLFAKNNNYKKLTFKDFFNFLKKIELNKSKWILIIILSAFVPIFANIAIILIGKITDTFFNPISFNKNNFNYWLFFGFLGFFIICIFLQKFLTTIQRLILNRAIINTGYKLRVDLYKKIQKLPLNYFDNHQTGDLMSALTNDINNITDAMVSMLGQLSLIFFQFLLTFTLMFLYAPILGLIALILIPSSTLVIILLIKNNQKYFFNQQKELGHFNGFLEEYLEIQPLVYVHQQQDKILKKFQKYNNNLVPNDLKSSSNMAFTFPWFHFCRFFNLLVIISIGALFIINEIPSYGITALTFGTLISFSIYITNVSENLSKILEIANTIQQGLGSIARVNEILELPEIENQKTLKNLNFIKGEIEFKNVSFAYPSNPDKLILKNVSFKIKSGESLALVGKTGCGKSTIAKLLSKFYLPTSGDILIDGQSIYEIKDKSWRSHIDMILQDTYIFNESVINNLLIANPDLQKSELTKILKYTSTENLINNLPNGLDTILESNGKNLSQGQKQLFTILRSIVSSREITIFDEATSDIDTISEMHIQKAIDYLFKQKTTIVIAHRLSTIVECDQILLIDNGQIIEQGNHQELLKLNGKYANLYAIGFNNN